MFVDYEYRRYEERIQLKPNHFNYSSTSTSTQNHSNRQDKTGVDRIRLHFGSNGSSVIRRLDVFYLCFRNLFLSSVLRIKNVHLGFLARQSMDIPWHLGHGFDVLLVQAVPVCDFLLRGKAELFCLGGKGDNEQRHPNNYECKKKEPNTEQCFHCRSPAG